MAGGLNGQVRTAVPLRTFERPPLSKAATFLVRQKE
jgi:hypothetical protein